METIDIGFSELEPISLNIDDSRPTVNFGAGIELLMNDKKKSSSTMNIDLGELDKLEDELNELSGSVSSSSNYDTGVSGGSTSKGETKTLSGFASNLFGFGNKSATPTSKVENDSKLGSATADGIGSAKTWDGYSKLNEVPLPSSSVKMTEREKRRKMRAMIKKLDEWYEKGLIKNTSRFNMDSSYEEVEDEYETALEDKRKKDSVKLQGWWFMTFINSLEYANTVFNPFDLNLDGWGEQVSEDIDSYEEIFSELHEKYKGGKLSPEISLLLRLGFSAAVVNITNKALSTATPGFNDVIRQSPELMKMFTNATVQSMSQQSPGFSMASNIVNNGGQGQNSMFGPPPAPIETKNQPPPQRPTMQFTQAQSNRPDISVGRGAMFRESGVELNQGQERFSNQERSRPQTPAPGPPPQERSSASARPEMRGPQNSEINNILMGLKTREVNTANVPSNDMVGGDDDNNDSMISISSLKDLQNTNMPKRAGNKRKQKSDRNIVSLDI